MAKNAQSKVGAQRAKLFKLLFANPVKGLTPAKLIQYLDAFNRGELRQAALLWQQILERDDQVGPCAEKRTRAVPVTYQILPIDDSREAARHKAALEYFYNNLTAFDGLNEMERGGLRQLIKQMMTALGMRYAMHEIIWKPVAAGKLTADFKFLPLQFFENTTGRLRFLETDFAMVGKDLDEYFGEGGWMCNAGRGLMVASSIAYLFKVPAGLKAWVSFMEKFGQPPIHATTSAAKDSAEWDAIVDAVEGYGEDLAIVTDESTKIEALDVPNGGQAPHPPLVERMDRAISRIWMGGDLATMSATGPSGTGSNPQSDDLDKLREDDAAMVTDALQYYVDRQVIQQLFGDGVAPLAYFSLVVPKKKTTDESVKKIETASKFKVPLAVSYVRQELNLPEPKKGEELISEPAPATVPGLPPPVSAANEQSPAELAREAAFKASAIEQLTAAQRASLVPLVRRLEQIASLPDAEFDAALQQLKGELPQLYRTILADPAVADAWEQIYGAALVDGAASAARQQATSRK